MVPSIRRLLAGNGADRVRVGLIVDGPNVLRDEFDVDLDDVRKAARSLGVLSVRRVYLDERAPPGLIQATEARGFEVIVTSGDVDVRLAIDATALVATDALDVLAVASRDTDFKPLFEYAAENGTETVVLSPGAHGRSDALINAAQRVIHLDEVTPSADTDRDPVTDAVSDHTSK